MKVPTQHRYLGTASDVNVTKNVALSDNLKNAVQRSSVDGAKLTLVNKNLEFHNLSGENSPLEGTWE